MEEINNFAWDEGTESIDFFGEVETNPTIKTEKKKEDSKEDKEKEDPLDISKETEEEETEDVFKEIEIEEKEEEEDISKEKEKAEKTEVKLNNLGVVSFLKEKGILNFELEEGKELDEDTANDILENKFEETIESKLKDLMSELPDTVKNLVKFSMNGGDVNEYINTITSKPVEITKDLDLDIEKNQELVVRARLEMQGLEEDDINDQIEFLKEKDKLADTAEKHFDKLIKDLEKEEEELVTKQKELKKKSKENQVKFKKEIQTLLDEKEDLKNFKLSKEDKKDLPDYISTPSVELQDGRVLTPFYHDLFETLKDKEKTLLLAKLIKSDFDFKDLEKKVKDSEAKNLKENLRRTEESTSKGGSSQPKRLVDYFN